MRPIEDLDCGIRTRFLRPSFLVKIGSALVSTILLIYLFVLTSRYSDPIWKEVIGRRHSVFCMVLGLSMIFQCLTFLFYFYKVFHRISTLCFFLSAIASAVYLVLVVVFCAGFASASKAAPYAESITEFVANQTDSAAAKWFLKAFNAAGKDDEALAKVVGEYVADRTRGAKLGLSVVSMIWLVFMAVLYFVVLFEAKTNEGDDAQLQYMRSEIQTP
jgi:succinate dehydrogenase hydrophobic anchor subunit